MKIIHIILCIKILFIIILSISLNFILKSNFCLLSNLFTKDYLDYFHNRNFFNRNLQINNISINYILNKKNKHKIENLFILIIIIPFLKSNETIINLKNKDIYELFKKILSIKKIKNNKLIIKEKDFNKFQNKIDVLLYNKWDFIPDFNLINIVRYIINNYYDEKCLVTFDKSLNLNLNYFIRNNYNHLSFNYLNKLMSKI